MPTPATGSPPLSFPPDDGFQRALHQRVMAYVATLPERRTDGGWTLIGKTTLLLAATALCYGLLVFIANAWWQALPLAVLLGLLAALIGFNIQHDGGHRAFSTIQWRNRAAAATLDLLGASSYLWRWKHGVFHHGFANIAGHDTDISVGRLVRLEPQQQREAHHRWQHLYIWALYGLMAIRWQLVDDIREVAAGAIGPHRIPRPRGGEMVLFIGGKVAFLALAFGLPLLCHPVLNVLLLYVVVTATLSLALALVFQLAHNTALCDFPVAPAAGRMQHSWARHQLMTTADFARDSKVLTWLLGGLNFQIEHHLFPHLSHVHYPALSPLVEETCREYGIEFREHPSLLAGLRAHVAWLRALGAAAPSATKPAIAAGYPREIAWRDAGARLEEA
jgi:linoleoyl-CoA desaturase